MTAAIVKANLSEGSRTTVFWIQVTSPSALQSNHATFHNNCR
ncbi:hypothetical protein AB0K00_02330 [Dactylosporangium sp. NPDC049525]